MSSRARAWAGALLAVLAGCGGGSGGSAPPPPPPVAAFSLPASITIAVTPYASSAEALGAEGTVDWNDDARARALTVAFAARELREHLALIGIDAPIVDGLRASTSPSIIVTTRAQLQDAASAGLETPTVPATMDEQAYVIVTHRQHLFIVGGARAGALNGAYRWLESLGFAWDDPDETLLPDRASVLARRDWPRIEGAPRVDLRGFWVYGRELPREFALWMARNRLNVSAPVEDLPLQRKLSLHAWAGEHNLIQEEFSRPGLFADHPEWFALINGVRRPVASTGNYFNPAFGNEAAADYFAARMIERLRAGDLARVDILNVWPADDRFNPFDQSPEALAVGNETDNLLKFYGVVARRLREAFESGTLPRRVTLAGISYYLTMRPPTNAQVIAALAAEDYLHLFYPITRSWNGPISANAADSDANGAIVDDLAEWARLTPFRSGVVDYHNQSIFGGVALTDELSFGTNHDYLTQDRGGLYAYMHPIERDPGPRRLTNALMARLGWQEASGPWARDRAALAESFTSEYFARRYGTQAAEWRRISTTMARSVENAQEMFGVNSLSWVVLQHLMWNPPFYSQAEAVAAIPAYRAGGVQALPAAFSGTTTQRASFRGLDESLALQADAQADWTAVLAQDLPATVRARLESDAAWYSATVSRYRLLAAACDFLTAREAGADTEPARQRMLVEISYLETLPQLGDALSPVNHAAFLTLYRQLAAI